MSTTIWTIRGMLGCLTGFEQHVKDEATDKAGAGAGAQDSKRYLRLQRQDQPHSGPLRTRTIPREHRGGRCTQDLDGKRTFPTIFLQMRTASHVTCN